MNLIHITTTTAHTRISPRSEVRDDVITTVAHAITLPAIDYTLGDYRVWGTYDGSSGMYAIYVRGHAAVLCRLDVDHTARQATLSIDFISGMKHLTESEVRRLGDLERIVAWTLIDHPKAVAEGCAS